MTIAWLAGWPLVTLNLDSEVSLAERTSRLKARGRDRVNVGYEEIYDLLAGQKVTTP